jgi:hypothetical protein
MALGNNHPRRLSLLGLLAVSALFVLLGAAGADPIDVHGGTVILPITGLELDLPPSDEGNGYKVSGSYLLTDEASFDGRDVIDEFRDGAIAAGTWISLGYFDAGEPEAIVAAVTLTDDWTAQRDLWGATWNVHGGTFTFDNELGAKPAVVACLRLGNGMSLLLHRFFLTESAPTTQSAMLDEFESSPVPRAAWLACTQGKVGTSYTTKRAESRNRGTIEPSRLEVLEHSGIVLQIPDDGFVWLVRKSEDGTTDFLDRMAPALPDVSVEVVYVADADCASALLSVDVEKREVPPQNLPDGWSAGPQLVVGDNVEYTACYPLDGGVVVVGFFQGAQGADVAYLTPMLEAIATAVAEDE